MLPSRSAQADDSEKDATFVAAVTTGGIQHAGVLPTTSTVATTPVLTPPSSRVASPHVIVKSVAEHPIVTPTSALSTATTDEKMSRRRHSGSDPHSDSYSQLHSPSPGVEKRTSSNPVDHSNDFNPAGKSEHDHHNHDADFGGPCAGGRATTTLDRLEKIMNASVDNMYHPTRSRSLEKGAGDGSDGLQESNPSGG